MSQMPPVQFTSAGIELPHPFGGQYQCNVTFGPPVLVPEFPPLYGIIANVLEADRVFKMGARAWIAGGTGGEGWHRFQWIAMARSHQLKQKWAPTFRFHSFRAAWVTPDLRGRISHLTFENREEASKVAEELEVFAFEQRQKHPNRRQVRQAISESRRAEKRRAP